MTIQDQVVTALTAWRENRGGGAQGMQSVINVIFNRAAKHNQSPYAVCTSHDQFTSINPPSSMTVAATETGLWPSDTDPQWLEAMSLAGQAVAGTLEDITEGATSYYALTMATPPYWAASMTHTVTIQNQAFYK